MAVDKIILELQADVKGFKAELGNVRKELDSTQKKVSDTGKNATQSFNQVGTSLKGLAATIGVAFGVQQIIEFGKASVKAASDIQETTTKVQQLFGTATNSVLEWSKKSASAFGQSQQQALDAAGTFAIFGRAAGLGGEDLVNFSTQFTELASDLASFNNTTPEEAIMAIGAALRGEAEPIRRYGVLLDEASLKQEALTLGIIKTTKEALTPQQRVLAAQAAIYKQTSAAQGDFLRTSDGLANQQRILAAELENIKATVGVSFLPTINELVTTLSEFATQTDFNKVMIELGEIFSAIFQPIGDILSAFNDLFEALTGTTSAGDKLIGILDILGGVIKFIMSNITLLSDIIVSIIDIITDAINGFKMLRQEGGLLGTVIDKLAIPFEWLAEQIGKLGDGQKKVETEIKKTTKAVTEQTTAVQKDTQETTKNTETKKQQLSAFELLNKQLDTAKQLLMEQVLTGKNYADTQQKIYDLTNKLTKAQDDYNEALKMSNIISLETIETDKEKPVLIDNTSASVKKLAAAYRVLLDTLPDPGEDPEVKRINDIVETAKGIGQVTGGLADLFTTIGDAAAQQGQKNAAFQKSLAVFAVQLKLAEAIANVIANITANSKDPLTLATNIIAGITAVTSAISQTTAILNKTEVPQYAEGTAFVGLNGNPKGIDTIPAYLNEGEAVIPTEMNKKYPGLASSWIKGNLDEYIMSNWVAPAIEQQRNKDLANNIAEALKINGMFDDYRLYRSLEKNSSINQSGFHSLAKAINKNNKKRGGYA